MRLRLIAVGSRMLRWVGEGWQEYVKRLSAELFPELVEIPLNTRGKNADVVRLTRQEGEAMLACVQSGERVVTPEVEGRPWSVEQLARELDRWRLDACTANLMVGGPEGPAPEACARSEQRQSLSPLTLPHPLVRTLVDEQIYRIWIVLSGHPYHEQSPVPMPQPIHLKDYERGARPVRRRVVVGAVAVVLLTLVLVACMYHLQVTQYEYHSTLSENNRVHVQPIPPTRGIISDRNGVIITDNRSSFSLTITRERAGDLQKTFDTLVEILGLTEDDRAIFEKRMKQGWRPLESILIIFELNEEQIIRIAVNQFRLPGVDVVTQLVRHYPLKERFAHSVGHVGRISKQELKNLDPINYSGTHHIDKIGIERFYESELHGTAGYEEVEIDARGRVLRVLKCTDPIPGKDIVLSIDSYLQEAAENALAGRRGTIVTTQPFTGNVLAAVSQPSYDPNLSVTGISFKAHAELRDSIDWPLYNRALRGLYLPGSTVKSAVAPVGLDVGVVTPISRVFDPSYYQLPNYDHKHRNWNCYGDGWVSLESAVYRSNDIYFYDLVHKLGIDRLYAFMGRFGFGQKVVLDTLGEANGLTPSREWKRRTRCQVWYPGETLILGTGQGYMQAVPIQLAQMTALLTNKGHWTRSHPAKTIDGQPPVDPDPTPDIALHDLANWDRVDYGTQQMVHGVRGTARKIGATSAYLIVGKSGTVQVVAIKQNERCDRPKLFERHCDHVLFVGFTLANNPQIVMVVMVESGKSGSGVAVPVVKQVMDVWLLDEHGKLKAEYAEPVALLAVAVAKPEPTVTESEVPAFEQ